MFFLDGAFISTANLPPHARTHAHVHKHTHTHNPTHKGAALWLFIAFTLSWIACRLVLFPQVVIINCLVVSAVFAWGGGAV